jgi:hypothetical protein
LIAAFDSGRHRSIQRRARFHEYTLRNGGFSEFNSPTYTIVALKELGRSASVSAPAFRDRRRFWRRVAHDATDLHAPLRLSFGDVHLELATPVV